MSVASNRLAGFGKNVPPSRRQKSACLQRRIITVGHSAERERTELEVKWVAANSDSDRKLTVCLGKFQAEFETKPKPVMITIHYGRLGFAIRISALCRFRFLPRPQDSHRYWREVSGKTEPYWCSIQQDSNKCELRRLLAMDGKASR